MNPAREPANGSPADGTKPIHLPTFGNMRRCLDRLAAGLRAVETRSSSWGWVALLAAFVYANWSYFAGRSYIPWDSTDEFFPQSVFVVRSLLRGDSPWWNPLAFAGTPVLADPQNMIFTPHTLTGVLTGSLFGQQAFDLTTLACLFAGALALLIYGRRIGGAPLTCVLGAILFMLGGVATSRLQHVVQIVSYSTIPVFLLALQHLCERPVARRALLLALVGLAMVLNPNQVVYLSAFALGPLGLLHVIRSPRPVAALLYSAIAVVLIVLFSLPMFSAIVEMLGASTRDALTVDDARGSSFPYFNLLSAFLPGLFGASDHASTAWTPTDLTQDYLYIGMIPSLALLWALLHAGRNMAPANLALALLPVFSIYALGTNTPLFGWLFAHLPGVSSFRRPADAAFLLNFLCALAITGIAPAAQRRRPTIAGLLLVLGFLIMVAWVVPSLRAYAASRGETDELQHLIGTFLQRAALACALISLAWVVSVRLPRAGILCAAVLVYWTTWDLTNAGKKHHFTGVVAWLGDAAAYRHPFRLAGEDTPLAHLVAAMPGADPYGNGPWRMEAIGSSMGANLPVMLGLADTQAYNPLRLANYANVFGAQNLQESFKRFTPAAPGYDAVPYRWIGLRYVLLAQYILDHAGEFGEFGRQLVGLRGTLSNDPSAKLAYHGAGYEVWELTDAMAKAELVDRDRLDWSAEPVRQGACSVASYRNTRVVVDCDAPRPARLVLNDTMAPGWRACVDGVAAPLSAFGGVMRSVEVPAGRSMTEFLYEPVPFLRGNSCRSSRQD